VPGGDGPGTEIGTLSRATEHPDGSIASWDG
jgi:hypothetical protein